MNKVVYQNDGHNTALKLLDVTEVLSSEAADTFNYGGY